MNEATSARDQVLRIAQAFFDAYNAKDADRLRELYADDVVLVDPALEIRREGADTVLEHFRDSADRRIPDRRITLDRIIADSEAALVQISWEGTPQVETFESFGTPPGTPIRIKACRVLEIRDDKIATITDYSVRAQD